MVEYGETREEIQEVPGLGRRKVTRTYRGEGVGWVITSEGSWEQVEVREAKIEPVEKKAEIPVSLPKTKVRLPTEREELPSIKIPIEPKVKEITVKVGVPKRETITKLQKCSKNTQI